MLMRYDIDHNKIRTILLSDLRLVNTEMITTEADINLDSRLRQVPYNNVAVYTGKWDL